MAKKEKSAKTQRGAPMSTKLAMAFAAAGAVASIFDGCDNSTNPAPKPEPKVCDCPAGTFHDEGVACCDGENCECKEAYNVHLGTKQIRVEDTTGLANRTEIQKAFTFLHTTFGTGPDIVHFENMNTNPIMVIEAIHDFRVVGNKFFIGVDKLGGDGDDMYSDISNNIYETIYRIYNDTGAPLMTKLSNKEINELGMQFDATRNIIYINQVASQHQNQA
jgi:hypothetical protein